MSDIDKWIEIAKECKYLPEHDLKVNNIYDILFFIILIILYFVDIFVKILNIRY